MPPTKQNNDRRNLAKSITLIESMKESDKVKARKLLESLPIQNDTYRIAISGPPGAGKSTFINGFGLYLIGQGYRVGVLAVDPSSDLSGGSILGDKTRMDQLSRHPMAFVRPSPARPGTLGGIATTTGETISLMEAASYDFIIVETVGIGQSEMDASLLTDLTLLILPPASGDELQGIKKGIIEHSDLIIINKDDGQTVPLVSATFDEYTNAVKGSRKHVFRCSSLEETGFREIYLAIRAFYEPLGKKKLQELRAKKQRAQLLRRIEILWPEFMEKSPKIGSIISELNRSLDTPKGKTRILAEKFYETLKEHVDAT